MTARVASLSSLAQAQGIQPLLLVAQEVEAATSHLSLLQDSPSYREEWGRRAKEADSRYALLPPGLARQVLGWAPEGLRREAGGREEAFLLWCQVLERAESGEEELREVVAELEASLGREVEAWPALQGEDPCLQVGVPAPEGALLTRLQGELGWADSSVRPPTELAGVLQGLESQIAAAR